MNVVFMDYNIRNGSIRWQIATSIKVIFEHLSLAFEILTFKIRDLENVGQGNNVQHSQWHIPDLLSDGESNVCICPAFTRQYSHLKVLP